MQAKINDTLHGYSYKLWWLLSSRLKSATLAAQYIYCLFFIRHSGWDGIGDHIEDNANNCSRQGDPDERHIQIRTQGPAFTTSCLDSVQDDEGRIHSGFFYMNIENI